MRRINGVIRRIGLGNRCDYLLIIYIFYYDIAIVCYPLCVRHLF